MKAQAASLAFLLTCLLAAVGAADESGGFVVRLGRDTTGVERFTQTASGVEIQQVGRAPHVQRRDFRYDMDTQAVAMRKLEFTLTNASDPAGAPPVQVLTASYTSDSMHMDIRRGENTQTIRLAMPQGTVMLSGTSPWEMYELLAQQLVRQKPDTLRRAGYYLGDDKLTWVRVRRMAGDSIEIQNQFDVYHARVDKSGRILHVTPIHGTQQFTVDRVPSVDLDAFAASFTADEKRAGAMGAYSARETLQVNAGGASLWLDYGRPQVRGRMIYGGLVPYGAVWRTGANAATQFKTDHALLMNGTAVPAGFYTLWSIPSPTGMKLVINSETGQWGTDHDPTKDLYTIDMQVSTLAPPVEAFTIHVESAEKGGVLRLDWETRRASLAFTAQP